MRRRLDAVTAPPLPLLSLKKFCLRALLCVCLWGAGLQGGTASAQEKKTYPFHEALRSQDLDAARRLLVRGGNELLVEADTFGMLPLHGAVSAGALESVRFLVGQGIDPNYKPEGGYSARIRGRSPLHLAVATGNKEIVSLLLEIGADVFAADRSGAVPLHLAIQYGRKDVALPLIKAMGERAHTRDQNGTTPLHIAARQGHDELVKSLLFLENKGLRQRVANFLAFQSEKNASNADSNLSYLVDIKNNFGLSPLHYAASGGHDKVVKLLLEQGATVNSFNARGLTPLFLASRDGHDGVVELLSSREATDLESGDELAHTPLCVAIANGHLQIFSRLLRRGADPHAKDKNGMIPLHIAAKRGNTDAVKSLLKTLGGGRGNINELDNAGNTPLLYAAATGKKELVESLVRAGADLKTRNSKGETSLDVAKKLGHASILPALQETR